MTKPTLILPCLLVFVFLSTSTAAQPQFSGWLASFNTVRLSKKISLHFDGQIRSTDKLEHVGTVLLRPGLNFHLNKSWTFTGGYALNLARRNLNGLSSMLAEHRIWQQALLNQKVNRITVTHRLRFEERFLPKPKIVDDRIKTDGHDNAYRLRYFLRSLFPLVGGNFSKGPFLALQNEVFFNTGDKSAVSGKSFDQNRLYGAIGYRLKGKLDVEAGYMNQYTVTRSYFVNNHIVQLAVYKRL